jgi:hypothetical protein
VTIESDDGSCLEAGAAFACGSTRALPLHGGAPPEGERILSRIAATSAGLEIERGPYGGQSVYYARVGEDVVVSSRLELLVRALPHPPALDIDALAACGVAGIGPDAGATVYRGIRRLASCERLRFEPDGRVLSTLHIPSARSHRWADARDAGRAMVGMLRSLLASALRQFPSLGVMAGGGLDSSALLALAAQTARSDGSTGSRGGARVVGLTMDYEAPGDDRPHMRALLRHIGGETLRVSPDELAPLAADFFTKDAAPYTPPTAPVVGRLYERARAWGADAIATGVYGDFVLDGDLASFALRARRGDLAAVADAARLDVPWTSTPWSRVLGLVVKPLLRSSVPASFLERRHARWLESLDLWHWAGPRLRPLLPAMFSPRGDATDDWLTSFATSPEATDRVDGVAQEAAAAGVPVLNVYEDPRFIELVSTISAEHLFLGHRSRGLFRDSMGGTLPDSLRYRRDKAMMEPMLEQMFAAVGRDGSLRSLLEMEATADLGLVEPAPFRLALDRLVAGKANGRGWQEQWAMLAVEGFVQRLHGAR